MIVIAFITVAFVSAFVGFMAAALLAMAGRIESDQEIAELRRKV